MSPQPAIPSAILKYLKGEYELKPRFYNWPRWFIILLIALFLTSFLIRLYWQLNINSAIGV